MKTTKFLYLFAPLFISATLLSSCTHHKKGEVIDLTDKPAVVLRHYFYRVDSYANVKYRLFKDIAKKGKIKAKSIGKFWKYKFYIDEMTFTFEYRVMNEIDGDYNYYTKDLVLHPGNWGCDRSKINLKFEVKPFDLDIYSCYIKSITGYCIKR